MFKLSYTQSQKKCNFSSWIFPGVQGQGHVTLDHGKWGFRQVVTRSIVEIMYNPRFTGIHSSPKERQLPKCCVSFEKECMCIRTSMGSTFALERWGRDSKSGFFLLRVCINRLYMVNIIQHNKLHLLMFKALENC